MSNFVPPPMFRNLYAPAPPERPRSRGLRRPHPAITVGKVRQLIETTQLNYAEISARTGVGRASICRWTRDQGWTRPPGAPISTDTVPTERASARLRTRTLAARIRAVAERYIVELETDPTVDLTTLATALELVRMAKLEDRKRKPRRRARADTPAVDHKGLGAAAMAAHAPPPARALPKNDPALRPLGRRSKLNQQHAWLLEKER